MVTGSGYAGPVVQGDKLIYFHRVGDEEIIECLHAETGRRFWKYSYPTRYRDMGDACCARLFFATLSQARHRESPVLANFIPEPAGAILDVIRRLAVRFTIPAEPILVGLFLLQ